MQPLPDLVNGLEVLKPFLTKYNFRLDNYENGKGSGGQFTVATFSNNNKKFIIGYRFSIGQVVYQCDTSLISHDFYLDGLGYAEQKQFPDFQSDDKLQGFRHILHDFDYLIDDFFIGSCSKLKLFAKQQEEQIKEHNLKAQEECKYQFDKVYIDNARLEFKNKNYKKCLDNYAKVEHHNILSGADIKTIEYCEKHK